MLEAPKFIKQLLRDIKEEIESNVIGDFFSFLNIVDMQCYNSLDVWLNHLTNLCSADIQQA